MEETGFGCFVADDTSGWRRAGASSDVVTERQVDGVAAAPSRFSALANETRHTVGRHAVTMTSGVNAKNILIVGAGPVGLAVAYWCRFMGGYNIVVSEPEELRNDMWPWSSE